MRIETFDVHVLFDDWLEDFEVKCVVDFASVNVVTNHAFKSFKRNFFESQILSDILQVNVLVYNV